MQGDFSHANLLLPTLKATTIIDLGESHTGTQTNLEIHARYLCWDREEFELLRVAYELNLRVADFDSVDFDELGIRLWKLEVDQWLGGTWEIVIETTFECDVKVEIAFGWMEWHIEGAIVVRHIQIESELVAESDAQRIRVHHSY